MADLAGRGQGPTLANLPTAYYLAVSGGGDNGAFGAGLLNGWSETGPRPEFRMVTGVSTGALIAPFAFLGPQYDPVLREVYTTLTPDRIFRARGLGAALFNDAMADTTPLADDHRQVRRPEDVRRHRPRIQRRPPAADRHHRPRRPAAGDLEHRRAGGQRQAEALTLFRQILRASAAIPGAVPAGDDRRRARRQEMSGDACRRRRHRPALPLSADRSKPARLLKRNRVAYIIRNARLDPDYSKAERRTINIAGRAIDTMLAASGHNDVCAPTSSASATASTTTLPLSAPISRSSTKR